MQVYDKNNVHIDPAIMMRVNRDTKSHSSIHRHEFVEIEYVLSGKCKQRINSKNYEADRGSIIIIPIGSTHSYTTSDNSVIINLLFTPEVLEQSEVIHRIIAENVVLSSERVFKIPTYFMHEFENTVLSMERECKDKNLEYKNILTANMQIFFCYIARAFSEEKPNSFSQILHNIDYQLIEGGNFSLKHISAMFNYNPNYFSSLFKKVAGMTYSEYIDKRRVELTINKLLYTDYTVENIYRSVGFRGKRHFYEVFRKQTGMSPTQYRNQTKNTQKKG